MSPVSSIKLSYRYDQTSVRLLVEGLPDLSLGQNQEILGILSSWRLQLVGSTELEGKLEHLQALMSVVIPYARHCISGVKRTFGDLNSPVTISPSHQGHKLFLRSSQLGVEPLSLYLDDSELADLVRSLDDLRNDSRIQLTWKVPGDFPLSRKELSERVSLSHRFGASIAGLTAFLIIFGLGLAIPLPQNQEGGSKEQISTLGSNQKNSFGY